jgi:hypothetical protein
VYCPQCGAEYREGFTECSDCQVALVWEKPPEPEDLLSEFGNVPPGRGDPDLELVTVLETGDPLVIAAARGLLGEAAIPFYVLGDEIGAMMMGHTFNSPRRVQVGRDREAEASAVLLPLKEPGLAGDPG